MDFQKNSHPRLHKLVITFLAQAIGESMDKEGEFACWLGRRRGERANFYVGGGRRERGEMVNESVIKPGLYGGVKKGCKRIGVSIEGLEL